MDRTVWFESLFIEFFNDLSPTWIKNATVTPNEFNELLADIPKIMLSITVQCTKQESQGQWQNIELKHFSQVGFCELKQNL